MSDILEPGMKVECITDLTRFVPWAVPVVGQTYTVRTAETLSIRGCEIACVRLAEIKNPVVWDNDLGQLEVCYRADAFRPLRTRPTDITIFREIDADVFSKDRVRA